MVENDKNSDQEPTPLGDAAKAAAEATTQAAGPDSAQAAAPVQTASTVPPEQPAPETDSDDEDDEDEGDEEQGEAGPETAKSVKADVKRALARETHDGKGDEDPGESDWISYESDDAEVNN